MITQSGLELLHEMCIKAEADYTIAKTDNALDVDTLNSIATDLYVKKEFYSLLLSEFNTREDG